MKSKLNFLAIFILISVLVFSGFQCTRPLAKKPITLVVWNLWDNSDTWADMVASYENLTAADETKAPVKIVYYQKVYEGSEKYEDEVNKALSKGGGVPDIITLNNSWVARYKDKISPLDGGAKTASAFERKFVDVVARDFLEGNKIYGMPLSVDTLALYYNVDLLRAAGIYDPPRTWDEFNEDVKKLTVRDDKGGIVRAGAALGTDKNVNRASDILSLLMMQSGSSIVDENRTQAVFGKLEKESDGKSYKKDSGGNWYSLGGVALQYYTDFANPAKSVYTWNPLMDYSIDAFYQGRAAMMINYDYNVSVVRAKAPKLNFAIAPMPQISGAMTPVNYANYWAMAVSSGSAHKQEAWDFLMYLSNPEISKMYLNKAVRPTAQRDLVSWQENGEDLNLAVFARQALTAKSWFQKDNFAVEEIFNSAINSIVLGRATPQSASELTATQLTQVMKE